MTAWRYNKPKPHGNQVYTADHAKEWRRIMREKKLSIGGLSKHLKIGYVTIKRVLEMYE